MTITIGDCARAAAAIYKNEDFPNYFLRSGIYDPKNSAVALEGYSVGLYAHLNAPNLYLISVRGSAKGKLTKDWMDDDVSIGFGRTPDRYAAALKFTQDKLTTMTNSTFMVVGHSLGGHIAQMVGAICGLPFVTFNAPPALGTWTGVLPTGVDVRTFKLGLNYRVNYDPVSLCSGKHVGPLITLKLDGKPKLSAHKKDTYLNSVDKEGIGNHLAMDTIAMWNGH